MQTPLVILILVIAAFFVGKRMVRIFKRGKTASCGGGCSGCNSSSCTSLKKDGQS